MINRSYFIILLTLILFSCSKNNDEDNTSNDPNARQLTIFFVNDIHAQLENFSKIKHIVDIEEETTEVIVTSAGDIFSGNPAVDYYSDKGYPIIDVMNDVGFDITAMGNHEFDYGVTVLGERMEQSDFDWVCANVDMGNTGITEPYEYITISRGDLNITFLGLVETTGKENDTIPLTHPWRVQDLKFEKAEDVVEKYANIKEQENADLYIALTHLGHDAYGDAMGDFQLASMFPYFDLIIGGHSHQKINATSNGIPVVQAGSYLNYLGKLELTILDKKIHSKNYSLINLDDYSSFDSELKEKIDDYNNMPELDEVIGTALTYHDKFMVGCFYTDALRGKMNVDITFQNTGGIRSDLNAGEITKREIYEIDPFNNGTVIYDMTVSDIKVFLKESGVPYFYSGVLIEQIGNEIQVKTTDGEMIPNNTILSLGINDYIPAVYDNYFPLNGDIQAITSAETIIAFLKDINDQVNYSGCTHLIFYE